MELRYNRSNLDFNGTGESVLISGGGGVKSIKELIYIYIGDRK